jgi:DNA-directed RNA polymerase specialized sigma24 family protein
MATTMRTVARPKAKLTQQQGAELAFAKKGLEQATTRYRRAVVVALREGASYREVSEATGLSTATLQKWKREAGQ